MRFLVSALAVFGCAVSVSGPVSTVDAQCVGDKVGATAVPAKGGTPSANALPLFYTFNQNSGAMTNAFRSNGLGGLAGADFFCNYEADAARFGTALLQQRKGLFKAVMSNRLTDAVDRFNAVNELTNGGTVHDVVDANNQCLTSSVDQLFFEGWNFNQALPDGRGNYAAANAIIDNFTGSLTDFTKWKVPTGTENASDNQVLNNAYCSTSTSATDQGWTSTTGTTKVGRIFSTTNNAEGDWISATDVGCTNGLHILCLQAAATPTTTPGGTGDPQFTGLQGQQFQVHGMPDEYFNLISSPDMQLNSRFAYLASGRCNYNNTECWTHPGTYVDQLGFMFPGLTIKAISGSHEDGMTVYVNEKRITTTTTNTHHTIHSHQHHDINTTQTVTITYKQNDQLIVAAPLFTITATNSDMFFNFGVSMHSPSLLSSGSALHHIKDKSEENKYPSFPLHGLLGQTWKNARYSHGRMFAGTVDDYMLLDSKLISNKFVYNQYKH